MQQSKCFAEIFRIQIQGIELIADLPNVVNVSWNEVAPRPRHTPVSSAGELANFRPEADADGSGFALTAGTGVRHERKPLNCLVFDQVDWFELKLGQGRAEALASGRGLGSALGLRCVCLGLRRASDTVVSL